MVMLCKQNMYDIVHDWTVFVHVQVLATFFMLLSVILNVLNAMRA